jgi:hypothetical protein
VLPENGFGFLSIPRDYHVGQYTLPLLGVGVCLTAYGQHAATRVLMRGYAAAARDTGCSAVCGNVLLGACSIKQSCHVRDKWWERDLSKPFVVLRKAGQNIGQPVYEPGPTCDFLVHFKKHPVGCVDLKTDEVNRPCVPLESDHFLYLVEISFGHDLTRIVSGDQDGFIGQFNKKIPFSKSLEHRLCRRDA